MSKQTKMFSMSLVPVILIVVLILGAGFFLLKGDILKSIRKDPNLIETRRLQNYPSNVVVATTDDRKKIRRVIKSQDELYNFLQEIDSNNTLPTIEKIDFSKEYLVAATTPTQVVKENEMKIKKIYFDTAKKEYLVSLKQTFANNECADTIMESNIGVDIVAIQKTETPISFDVTQQELPCDTSSN